MTEQVALNGEYDPLVTVPLPEGGLECWPSTPRYESIRDGAELAASGINLESHWAKPWKDSHPKTLVVGTDYDLVVLGISIGGLPLICQQLINHFPEWRSMIGKVDTVATQAMQLWLSPTISDLGWTLPSPLVVNYEDPASNWLDASQVIRYEPLKSTPVGSVAYFCSALEDAQAFHRLVPTHLPRISGGPTANAPAVGRAACRLPVAGSGEHRGPAGSGQLGSPSRSAEPRGSGSTCLAVLPRERAAVRPVRPLVGGRHRVSLPPNDSKVGNLKLAGDWTKNGFNCGCVEATVISGLLLTCDLRLSTPLLRRTPFGMFNL